MTAPRSPAAAGRHRFAVFTAGFTFALLVAGGLVTSTGSGLAVPDWPLSFGQVFPRMEGGVLYEHGHRLIAATAGVLTVILAFWTARAEPRAWVRRLGWGMLAAVVVQGVLGGTTVLLRLPDAVSVSHAGLGQIFFALAVVMASATGPRFLASVPAADDSAGRRTRGLVITAAAGVFVQILLGAVVRHSGAGLAIPDFPLAFGRLVPPLGSSLVAWHFAHRVGAVVVALLVLWAALRVIARQPGEPWVTRPALALVALIGFQVFLGGLTVLTRKAVIPTTAHLAVGALLLGTAVVLALRLHRAPAVLRAEPALAPLPSAG